MIKKLQKRCDLARTTDKKYREDNGFTGEHGYTLTLGTHCMGFALAMPEIGGRNPIFVDQDGDCYAPMDRNQWRCITTPEKLPPIEKNGEHISAVAMAEMVYAFPSYAQIIREWFAACTLAPDYKGWRKLEYWPLGKVLDAILRNRSADEVLS